MILLSIVAKAVIGGALIALAAVCFANAAWDEFRK
jgi:uncharacterized membrane protein